MNFSVNSGSWTHSWPNGRFDSPPKPDMRLRHVGLKADPALLAVIGDIDAGPALLLHHVSDALLDHVVEFGLVDLFAGLVGDQQRH